jgi:hypothetical protein
LVKRSKYQANILKLYKSAKIIYIKASTFACRSGTEGRYRHKCIYSFSLLWKGVSVQCHALAGLTPRKETWNSLHRRM